MPSYRRMVGVCLLSVVFLSLCSCGVTIFGHLSFASQASDPLAHYYLSGNTWPVLDPSIMRQGSTYYAFSTDVAGLSQSGNLGIRCSQDKVTWTACGSVFPEGIPKWVRKRIPGIVGLWAPDVSFFNGEYHVYYNGSTLHSQRTVIGLATNTTLDAADPEYQWVDRGLVLESKPGDDFNALDPNILTDTGGAVWLTYGSYWTGIKQREIDPATGMLLASNPTRYDLATRPSVPHNPIEGASLVRHGSYYYLFVSVDYCCEQDTAADNYKQAMGRSLSAHGPFVDEDGTPMLQGGGTVLLKGDGDWSAPGGGTAYVDPDNGESMIIFHAHSLADNGNPYQWIKRLQWENDWPVIGQ
jgi:arabinan endo-1,5-alpha-L-arabinosidase